MAGKILALMLFGIVSSHAFAYDEFYIINTYSGRCLGAGNNRSYAKMEECDYSSKNQRWRVREWSSHFVLQSSRGNVMGYRFSYLGLTEYRHPLHGEPWEKITPSLGPYGFHLIVVQKSNLEAVAL